MCCFGVGDIVVASFGDWDVVVCDVCFGVWFACAWQEVRDRVVDGFPADVAGSASASYVLTHPGLHGAVAFHHGVTS